MKVLMAMDVYLPDVDGVITCMDNYCKVLNDKVEIEAIAPKNKPGYVDDRPYKITRCKSMRVPIMKMYSSLNPHKDKQFKAHIYGNNYDIIHLHSPFAMGKFALKYARSANIPIIATFHSNFRPIFRRVVKYVPFGRNMAEALVKRVGRFYNQLNEVFVCSPEIEKQARSFGYTGKITYVPFGTNFKKCPNPDQQAIEANKKFGLDKDELVFLFVGRLSALKRVHYSMDALKILKDKGVLTNFKFYVLGVGYYREKLIAHAEKLGLTENMVFWGMTEKDDLGRIYARADLFLFPSLYDNFGLVKVEAAAFSTPAIMIKDSAAGYGVTDGVNGYLSDDSREAFAARIEDALHDRVKLKTVGKNAARDIYCSWDDCAAVLIENYKRIIEEHKQGIKPKPVSKEIVKKAKRDLKISEKQANKTT